MSKIANISLGFSEYPTNAWAINIYISGCNNYCEDCHNLDIQNPEYGTFYDISELANLIKSKCESNRTKSIVLLGGDPLYAGNIKFTDNLIYNLRDYDICIYTGYEINHVQNSLSNINLVKYIKTGKYYKSKSQTSKKTDSELILSSFNQSMYKVSDNSINLISNNGIVMLQWS